MYKTVKPGDLLLSVVGDGEFFLVTKTHSETYFPVKDSSFVEIECVQLSTGKKFPILHINLDDTWIVIQPNT